MTKVLKGKPVVEGVAEGIALVSKTRLNLLHDVDKERGLIIAEGHELYGQSIKDKVFVFPSGVGTVGLSTIIYTLVKNGVGPKALICQELETTTVFGALLAKLPMVAELDEDPTKVIKTGVRVKVDGTLGIVTVYD